MNTIKLVFFGDDGISIERTVTFELVDSLIKDNEFLKSEFEKIKQKIIVRSTPGKTNHNHKTFPIMWTPK